MQKIIPFLVLAACGVTETSATVEPSDGGTRTQEATLNTPTGSGSGTPGVTGISLNGSVCVVVDPRAVPGTSCSAAGSGVEITLDKADVFTDGSGDFVVPFPTDEGIEWRLNDFAQPHYTSSTLAFGGETAIPTMNADDYDTMNSNAATDDGPSVFVYYLDNTGTPVHGARIFVTPLDSNAEYTVHYEGTDPLNWNGTATGANGAAWITGGYDETLQIDAFPTGQSQSGVSPLTTSVYLDYGNHYVVMIRQ